MAKIQKMVPFFGETGKKNDFKAAVMYLIPAGPVAKKHLSGNKRGIAEISSTEVSSAKKDPKKVGVSLSGAML